MIRKSDLQIVIVVAMAMGLPVMAFVIFGLYERQRHSEFQARYREVSGAITAINNYYENRGLWPSELRDLPDSESIEVPSDWTYIWGGYDSPPYFVIKGLERETMSYAFAADPCHQHGEWSHGMEDETPFTCRNNELDRAWIISELKRRMQRFPTEAQHAEKREELLREERARPD